MKRLTVVFLALISLGVLAWAGFQAVTPATSTELASLMPPGTLVYVEAKDFASLLQQWDSSSEKTAWMKSDNYEVFSRSRLLLRLQQAQEQFANAAGVPPNYKFLSEVSGDRTALGIYDIGKLELLYVTHAKAGSATQTAIWQQRSKFEPRSANGNPFYVRKDAESGKVVAFAVYGDYLLLATREDLIAGALAMLSGQKMNNLAQEAWFASTTKLAKQPGDLRLVVHLADVVKTPHFRTYWVQQNITDLAKYESSIADLRLDKGEYREERALLLNSADEFADDVDAESETARLAGIVPEAVGIFRVSASPSSGAVLASLEQTVLTPRLGPALPEKTAPTANIGEGTVGSPSDLERRIDMAPSVTTTGSGSDEQLRLMLAANRVRALLEVHRTERSSDGVFIKPGNALIVSSSSPWDEAAVLKALNAAISPGMTAGGLGMGWTKTGTGNQSYWRTNGLHPMAVAVRERLLIIATDAALLTELSAGLEHKTSASPVVYAARFRHDLERENFDKLTAVLDRSGSGSFGGTSDRQPQFFSQNVGSLSRTFAGVKSETVTVTREGGVERQLVRYEWSR